jgi:hypothetical protein
MLVSDCAMTGWSACCVAGDVEAGRQLMSGVCAAGFADAAALIRRPLTRKRYGR